MSSAASSRLFSSGASLLADRSILARSRARPRRRAGGIESSGVLSHRLLIKESQVRIAIVLVCRPSAYTVSAAGYREPGLTHGDMHIFRSIHGTLILIRLVPYFR